MSHSWTTWTRSVSVSHILLPALMHILAWLFRASEIQLHRSISTRLSCPVLYMNDPSSSTIPFFQRTSITKDVALTHFLPIHATVSAGRIALFRNCYVCLLYYLFQGVHQFHHLSILSLHSLFTSLFQLPNEAIYALGGALQVSPEKEKTFHCTMMPGTYETTLPSFYITNVQERHVGAILQPFWVMSTFTGVIKMTSLLIISVYTEVTFMTASSWWLPYLVPHSVQSLFYSNNISSCWLSGMDIVIQEFAHEGRLLWNLVRLH